METDLMTKTLAALSGALLATSLATSALAATEIERALADGGVQMTADQIVERLAGKTVTFENATSGAKALLYYDGQNSMLIKPLGSDDVIEGFYAVDLADHICLSAHGQEPMRLRCVNVLLVDGMMHKYELDGSLRGRVIEEVSGNTM